MSDPADDKITTESAGHGDHDAHGADHDDHSGHHDVPADAISENSLEDGLLFVIAVAVMGALACLIFYWGSLHWTAPAVAENGAAETTEHAPIK